VGEFRGREQNGQCKVLGHAVPKVVKGGETRTVVDNIFFEIQGNLPIGSG